ncbi:alpha/beta hydrolase [Kribbella sp. NBC_01245]|uniref:alpha/beta fold hydrolase n=1 Tax=Kribbella sp. NBC_01245 TaxID=2903578 RepID=UPI002E28B56F|nr:alpha/beta hydrolase [Kribbella sp. NBC_01245]
MVAADGVRLRVVESGSAEAAVTVLLAHGWTCSTRSWHHQLADLPRLLGPENVRVIAWDHRGHGQSEAAPDGTTRIEQLAEDVVTLLDTLVPSGPLVYAGHSMGGMTLLALAEQRPDLFGERIAAAALISTSTGRLSERAFGLPRQFNSTAAVVAPRAVNLAGQRIERRARKLAAQTSAGSSVGKARLAARWREFALAARLQRPALQRMVFGVNPDPAEVDILLADLADTPGRSLAGFFEAITQHNREDAAKVLADLPIEVMHGTRDRLISPRHANRTAELLPNARLWMYPKAGHMLMQERPRDVSQRLAGLVRRTARAQVVAT